MVGELLQSSFTDAIQQEDLKPAGGPVIDPLWLPSAATMTRMLSCGPLRPSLVMVQVPASSARAADGRASSAAASVMRLNT